METASESSSLVARNLSEDLEERGLRILAKVIARRLVNVRTDEYPRARQQSEHNSPDRAITDENIP